MALWLNTLSRFKELSRKHSTELSNLHVRQRHGFVKWFPQGQSQIALGIAELHEIGTCAQNVLVSSILNSSTQLTTC